MTMSAIDSAPYRSTRTTGMASSSAASLATLRNKLVFPKRRGAYRLTNRPARAHARNTSASCWRPTTSSAASGPSKMKGETSSAQSSCDISLPWTRGTAWENHTVPPAVDRLRRGHTHQAALHQRPAAGDREDLRHARPRHHPGQVLELGIEDHDVGEVAGRFLQAGVAGIDAHQHARPGIALERRAVPGERIGVPQRGDARPGRPGCAEPSRVPDPVHF